MLKNVNPDKIITEKVLHNAEKQQADNLRKQKEYFESILGKGMAPDFYLQGMIDNCNHDIPILEAMSRGEKPKEKLILPVFIREI